MPGCLESLRESVAYAEAQLGELLDYEVIVVVNRCTDSTEEIARAAGCRIVKSEAKNLSIIRNTGVAAAQASRIITIDADSRASKNMFLAIGRKFSNAKVFGGGVLIIPERWSLGIILSGLALLPLALKERIAAGLFFVRKDVFDEIGGFDENYFSAEDVDFAKRLRAYAKKNGGKFAILVNAYIVTSCRKFDKFGDYYILRQLPSFLKLLKGEMSSLADKIWYDFKE